MALVLIKDAKLIFQLLISGNEKQEKLGLQKACECLENGKIFRNQSEIVSSALALLNSDSTRVRRWAFKFIALNKQRVSNHLITHLLALHADEEDPENRSWIVTALFAILHDDEIADHIKGGRIDLSESANPLAAQLFYEGNIPAPLSGSQLLLPIENSSLHAKWEALNFGYGKSGRLLLPTHIAHKELIKDLISHDDPEVSEYSLWALHKNKHGSDADIIGQVHHLLGRPGNVRRWLYRLLTKTPKSTKSNYEVIREQMLKEPAAEAREGLAIGIGEHFLPEYSDDIVTWYMKEQEDSVRDHILEHMARNCRKDPGYAETIDHAVLEEPLTPLRRQRIITNLGSISSADRIFSALSRSTVEQLELSSLDQQAHGTIIMKETNFDLRKAKIDGGNVNLGDQTVEESAISKSGDSTVDKTTLQEAAEEFSKFVTAELQDRKDERKKILKLIEKAQNSNTKKSRNSALSDILKITKGTRGLYEKASGFVSSVKSIFKKGDENE